MLDAIPHLDAEVRMSADQLARALDRLLSVETQFDAAAAEQEAREALAAHRAQAGEAVGIFEGSFTGNIQGEAWLKVRSLGPIPEPGTKLYAAPHQVAQPLDDRQFKVVKLAMSRFITDAYNRMDAAAQDKSGRYFKLGAVESFAADARDAQAALAALAEARGIKLAAPTKEPTNG